MRATGTTIIAGRGLERVFANGGTSTYALRNISIELRAGEFVLLMGPSGSGKTTLLAALSGLLRPDAGSVEVFGANLWNMSERQREEFRLQHFGFIFQGFNLFPYLTAREQLEMVLRWSEAVTPQEARRRVTAVLEEVGLGCKGQLCPAQLSGGEKQRVAVARALIKNPELCFADEPTSALDWAHGKHIIELLRRSADRGAIVFVVSHDQRLAPYADRVLMMEDGSLSTVGLQQICAGETGS